MSHPLRRHHLGAALTCLAALLAGAALAAPAVGDWPRFRGPTGQGVSPDKGLPLTWSQKENLRWKVELPGPGSSSPVILGKRLFLTCFSGYVPGQPPAGMDRLKRHVLCFDADSGKLLWDTPVASRLPDQPTMRENHGYASSTPVVDAERVYTFFGKSGIFAFDQGGKQLWHADVGAGLNEGFGTGASPMLAGDLLIVNASVESESLIALDRKSGKEVWRARGIRESFNTPVLVDVGGKQELVVATQPRILAFDPATGQQLWSCATEIRWYMVPSVVAHDGVVYYLGGRDGVVGGAVKAGGRGDVTSTHRLWTTRKGSNVTSPIYHAGHLYWMNDNLGIAYCAEAKTGNILYEERVGRAGQVYGSPILASGRIYYPARGGQTFVVAAEPKYRLLAVNDLGERATFNASPAASGGRLYLRSDRHLFCIGER